MKRMPPLSKAATLVRWLSRLLIGGILLYVLGLFVVMAIVAYAGKPTAEALLDGRFHLAPDAVRNLQGEGEQWLDYYGWLAFQADEKTLPDRWEHAQACADKTAQAEGFAHLALKSEAVLALSGAAECLQWRDSAVPESTGFDFLYDPVSGYHFYREWQR